MNAPHPIRFSRDDYHRIATSGVLDRHARVELIGGEIAQMSLNGSAHETCLSILLRGSLPRWVRSGLSGTEVVLAIKMSDSSLEFDRKIKARLYAEEQIANNWIFNVVDRCIEVHTETECSTAGGWPYQQVVKLTCPEVELPITSNVRPIKLKASFP